MAEKDDFDDSGGQVASHGNSLRPQTPPKTAGNASDAKAGKNNIKVFMRVRPAAKPFSGYTTRIQFGFPISISVGSLMF